MIGMSSSSRNFEALGTYLVAGRSGAERDRVAWSASRNLPTDDPELGAKIMRATAAQNLRVEKPVYHLALSFDPNDLVDRAMMERVADRVLTALQLQDHQVIIVAHKDREHAHVHLLVNRVHPETGLVWSRWQDQRIVQQVLREEERALGLRQVPGRLTRERESRELMAGLVEASASKVATLPSQPLDGARKTYDTVDELATTLRTYEHVMELTQRQYTAKLDADAARARLAQLAAAFDRAHAAEGAFLRALGNVYRVPEKARESFIAIAREQGTEAAARALRDTPERLGALLTVERRRALGFAVELDDRPARAVATQAGRLGQEAVAAAHALSTTVAEVRARRMGEMVKPDVQAGRGVAVAIENLVGFDLSAAISVAASERAASAQLANQATEHDRALSRDLRAAPTLPELREQIARTADRLLPREVRRLRTMVTAPQLALMTALRATVRDALLAREAEHSA